VRWDLKVVNVEQAEGVQLTGVFNTCNCVFFLVLALRLFGMRFVNDATKLYFGLNFVIFEQSNLFLKQLKHVSIHNFQILVT
jgi:hypothetical protein